MGCPSATMAFGSVPVIHFFESWFHACSTCFHVFAPAIFISFLPFFFLQPSHRFEPIEKRLCRWSFRFHRQWRDISLPSSTSFVPLWIGLTSSLSESSRSIGDRDRVRDPPCKLNNRMIWFFCRMDCASASSFSLIDIVWLVECHYWLRFIERRSRVAFFRVEKVRILLFGSWVVKDRNKLRRTEIFVNREGFVRRWFSEKSTINDG